MTEKMQAQAQDSKEQQNATYRQALLFGALFVVISAAALLVTLLSVFQFVIRPLGKTRNEINGIISDIDRREGDLTINTNADAVKKEVDAMAAQTMDIMQ